MRQVRIRAVAAGAAIALAASLVAACGSDSNAGSGSASAGAGAGSASAGSSSEGSASASSASAGSSSEGSASAGSESGGSAVDLSKDTKKAITIPIASGWAEDVAVTHLWKYVLEQNGYTVKTPTLDIGPIFVGIAKGDYDVFFDTWLPGTHHKYWVEDGYGAKSVDIGVWYKNAPLTIAVPDYMDIDSIADLKSIGDQVNKTITGIDPGAGETGVVKDMMKAYGLTDAGWTLKTSSSTAMLAALKKATDAKKPIVVDLWRPHWAYAAFPIKDLKDPKGAMGKPDSIHVIGSKDFAKADPGLTAALKNFTMTGDDLNSLEAATVQDSSATEADIEAGVKKWAGEHPDVVKALLG